MDDVSKPDSPSLHGLANQPAPGIINELWDFVRTNKKWWLTPIIAMLLLVGGFILLTSTAAGTFIYTLF